MCELFLSFNFKLHLITKLFKRVVEEENDAVQTRRRICSASLINKLLLMKEIINFCLPLRRHFTENLKTFQQLSISLSTTRTNLRLLIPNIYQTHQKFIYLQKAKVVFTSISMFTLK